ncbi:Cof-type HAD-IIB family hydrolase [Paenibacillus allorhizosphaerae]|uniref:Sugar phosphatase YidA n=1 Tax=Paenibacillus allorhizosphaerae TaxID=2849866 RepID=A0ABM8VT43_9BACL|nr:Cof-type HAD-IIB family hydrolase [Paenibacillus allorhizosphaerae]CAG7657191.1 Sugar phosphatase YidA [Paenibacillus allorhizosphaerae]
MSSIRLIVSDLDGTLLSEDNRLSDSVIDAVRRFRASGGLFTIATGRFGPSAQPIVDSLDIDIPYILCNGCVIADRHKIWETAQLPLGEIAPFLLGADQAGVTVLLFGEDGIRTLRATPETEYFVKREGLPCIPLDSGDETWPDRPVQKVVLIGEMNRIKPLWDRHRSGFASEYAAVQSEDHFFEIMPARQSKGEALKKLMVHLGVAPSEVMNIGNQLNDLDMIEQAGIGVAVANSHDELIRQASYVCRNSYGDGVVEAMERFAAIGSGSMGGGNHDH